MLDVNKKNEPHKNEKKKILVTLFGYIHFDDVVPKATKYYPAVVLQKKDVLTLNRLGTTHWEVQNHSFSIKVDNLFNFSTKPLATYYVFRYITLYHRSENIILFVLLKNSLSILNIRYQMCDGQEKVEA